MKIIILFLMLTLATMAEKPPQFESYASTNTFLGNAKPLDFKSHPQAWEFRTRLREGAKEKPNFAGYYILVTWGCGSPCQQVALIDARDGKIYFAPFVTGLGGRFNLKSRLFIKDAPEDIADFNKADPSSISHSKVFETEYWLWDEDTKRFKLLLTTEPKSKSQPAKPLR